MLIQLKNIYFCLELTFYLLNPSPLSTKQRAPFLYQILTFFKFYSFFFSNPFPLLLLFWQRQTLYLGKVHFSFATSTVTKIHDLVCAGATRHRNAIQTTHHQFFLPTLKSQNFYDTQILPLHFENVMAFLYQDWGWLGMELQFVDLML